MHFHAAEFGAVNGAVAELVEVEVGTELAVDPPEQIRVELGGHALRIVIGGLEGGPVLGQVGPEQEAILGAHDSCDLPEQSDRFLERIIAQAGSRKTTSFGPSISAAATGRAVW